MSRKKKKQKQRKEMATVKLKVVQAHNAYMRLSEKLAGLAGWIGGWLTKPTLAAGKINKEENTTRRIGWENVTAAKSLLIYTNKSTVEKKKR